MRRGRARCLFERKVLLDLNKCTYNKATLQKRTAFATLNRKVIFRRKAFNKFVSQVHVHKYNTRTRVPLYGRVVVHAAWPARTCGGCNVASRQNTASARFTAICRCGNRAHRSYAAVIAMHGTAAGAITHQDRKQFDGIILIMNFILIQKPTT